MLSHILSVTAVTIAMILVMTLSLSFTSNVTAQRQEEKNEDYERVLLGMGSNAQGELGFLDYTKPFYVESLSNVVVKPKTWCASTSHVVVLANETNEIYTWGYNDIYQTGHGDHMSNVFVATPLVVDQEDISGYEWDQVLCGKEHTIVRDSKAGVALVWGLNSKGSAGLNARMDPIKTPTLSTFFSADADFFSIRDGAAIWKVNKGSNKMFAIGGNTYGQLGEVTSEPEVTADQPTEVTSMYDSGSGLVSNLLQVVGNAEDSLFLLENGELYTVGTNSYGTGFHLDNELRRSGVKKIASNNVATWVVTDSGVDAFGSNYCGRVSADFDRDEIIRGDNASSIDTTALGGSPIDKISISKTHVVVLTEDHKVFGLGCNDYNQLANASEGENNHISTLREFDSLPSGETIVDVIAIDNTTLMLSEKGKIIAMGRPNAAGYGVGLISATEIETPKRMDRVFAGDRLSFAFTPYDGEVYSFGRNLAISTVNGTSTTQDQLVITGVEDLMERNITEMTLSGIGDGPHNAYALDSDRIHIYGTGDMKDGQLLCSEFDCEDLSNAEPRLFFEALPLNTTKIEMIDSGAAHFASIARPLSSLSQVRSLIWGRNQEGQAAHRGASLAGNPVVMDDNAYICTGDYHTMAIDLEGKLLGTGRNVEGQIASKFFLDQSNTFQYVDQSDYGNQTVTTVYCGATSTFAIVENGDVYVFGDNSNGQLGMGKDEKEIRLPKRNPYLSDLNKKEASTLHPGILKISSAKHAGGHTLVLTAQGELYGMGRNDMHQLGNSSSQLNQFHVTKIELPSIAMKDGPAKVIDISAGYQHSLIIVGRKTCPNDCSNDAPRGIKQGVCDVVTGQCACDDSFSGFDCSQRTCKDPLCSGAGKCDETRGICDCLAGYSGESCESRRCANNCSGQGRCNRRTGVCLCDSGWTGADCSKSGAMGSHASGLASLFVALCVSVLLLL